MLVFFFFRETIFTEPDVLASPVLDMDATFNIVLQVSEYMSVNMVLQFNSKLLLFIMI